MPSEPFIKEVILENFMSYEYGRIPLKGGLNVVLGPNGAGKSSILLGISVALGQAYTERSRRLSDLVKRGKDIARVTLLLNNSQRNGKRPLPFRADLIHLSRYIRKDGTYWFEIDFKEASKLEVTQTLTKLGLNPDNMLIIMHQGLGDAFSMVSPQEKLAMVEDAVGLAQYRKSLLEAKERLEKIRSEKEEREKELRYLAATLEKWKEQYDKFLKLEELRNKVAELQLKEGWAKVAKCEASLSALEEKMKKIVAEKESLQRRIAVQESELPKISAKLEDAIKNYGIAERKRERARYSLSILDSLKDQEFSSIVNRLKSVGLLEQEKDPDQIIAKLDAEVSKGYAEIMRYIEELADVREKLSVLKFRLNEAEKEERQVARQKEETMSELSQLVEYASQLGNRPEVIPALNDIQAELKVAQLQINELGNVASDAEAMYKEFQDKMKQLQERIEQLDRNKQETLKEVQERFSVWKKELQSLVSELSKRYGEVLSMVGGNGRIALTDLEDPVNAGLMLMVSFRGDQLVPLDAYTQSGGERSTAVAAFLLALQGKVVSPFRAVDEFDVHMDKVNRQLFMKAIYEMFKKEESTQYLVITPVEPDVYDPYANYIMVHKVASSSRARQVEKIEAKK